MVQGEEWSQFDLPFRARLPPRSTQSSDQQASRLKEVEIAKIRSFQGNTDHGAHPGYVSSDRDSRHRQGSGECGVRAVERGSRPALFTSFTFPLPSISSTKAVFEALRDGCACDGQE